MVRSASSLSSSILSVARALPRVFFVERLPGLLEDRVGDRPFGRLGHRLGPGERAALAVGVEGGLAPGVEQVEPLLGLAGRAGVLGMHIDAVGAAVDLRGPQLHQMQEPVLQPAAAEVDLQAEQGPDGAGGRLRVIEPGLHRQYSLNSAVAPPIPTRMVGSGGTVERATLATCYGATSMPRNSPTRRFDLDSLALDAGARDPIHLQLRNQIRRAILEGRLRPGERVPSTRGLAGSLGIGRNTVASAYDQLASEGYLAAAVGSGTRVSRTLPEPLLN